MFHARRLADHGVVSTTLSLLSDRQVRALVEDTPVVRSGIGGTAMALEVDGVRVFAKRIPLTELERRPENALSTANLFALPTFYQYGLGSAGFGVWRELAAHVMTTDWVLGGQCANFPLLHHWRVVDGPPATAREHDDLEGSVAYWNGSPAVRARLEAIKEAPASVVLFLEHFPYNLAEWLALGNDVAPVVRGLEDCTSFLRANGMVHFDAHPGNVLADEHGVYLTDFGLATSSRFALSEAELGFLEQHLDFDTCHAMAFLLDHVADPPAELLRYAPVTAVLKAFYQRQRDDKATPYPETEISRARPALT